MSKAFAYLGALGLFYSVLYFLGLALDRDPRNYELEDGTTVLCEHEHRCECGTSLHNCVSGKKLVNYECQKAVQTIGLD